MNQVSLIVSIILVIASLVLVTRGASFRDLGTGRTLRLALIWIAIILGLVFVIRYAGLGGVE